MSGDVSDRKRLLAVTAGNLEHQHTYFTGHQDFFAPECVGGSNRKKGLGHPVRLYVEGLIQPIGTEITGGRSGVLT